MNKYCPDNVFQDFFRFVKPGIRCPVTLFVISVTKLYPACLSGDSFFVFSREVHQNASALRKYRIVFCTRHFFRLRNFNSFFSFLRNSFHFFSSGKNGMFLLVGAGLGLLFMIGT